MSKPQAKSVTTQANTADDFSVLIGDLVPSPKNVRRYNLTAGIEELAASIEAHGIIHNLRVRLNDKGKHEVVAGARRLAAIHKLQKDKRTIKGEKITKNTRIFVSWQDEKDNDTEISLAENIARVGMHPADEFEAFRKLSDEGMTPEQIGDRYGISHMTVRRRLKLANLSPKIIQAYKDEEATLEQLEALAVSDDHEAQEKAFFDAESYMRHPNHLKNALTSEDVRSSHPVVQFVTVAAYEEAGGAVSRDLFSDDDSCYLTDKALLIRLACQKIDVHVKEVDPSGWKWVEGCLETHVSGFNRIYTHSKEPAKKDEKRLSDLAAKFDKVEEAYQNADEADTDLCADLEKQAKALEAEIEAIKAKYEVYDETEQSYAGVMVHISRDGSPKIVQGLVKDVDWNPLQKARLKAEESDTELESNEGEGDVKPEDDKQSFSMALVEDLTAYKTLALGVELAKRPDIALAVAVHPLALKTFYGGMYHSRGDSGSELTNKRDYIRIEKDDETNVSAITETENLMVHWRERLPDEADSLWSWILEQDQTTLLELLAAVTSQSVNAWQRRGQETETNRHADEIASALCFDMRKYWKPSSDFFKRTTKAVAIAACQETGQSDEFCASMMRQSKTDLVNYVSKQLETSGWLPEPLRTAGYSVQETDEGEAMLEAAE